MPDQAFRNLFAETENVRWETVSQVQKRARRRATARAATVAGIVAVGLVGGGVAVAGGNRGDHPVTPPPSSPAPSSPRPSAAPPSAPPSSPPASPPRSTGTSAPSITGITPAMMLRPQDAGSGYVVASGTDGDWSFEFNASVFGCPRGSKPSPESDRSRALRKGQPQDETYVLQHTGRYSPGEAAGYLDQIRSRVSSCDAGAGRSVRIAAQGFAGDQSLLVVFDHGGGFLTRTILVREGDVLTEIFTKPTRGDQASRELGRKAAARL
jgi:hypothetical protein